MDDKSSNAKSHSLKAEKPGWDYKRLNYRTKRAWEWKIEKRAKGRGEEMRDYHHSRLENGIFQSFRQCWWRNGPGKRRPTRDSCFSSDLLFFSMASAASSSIKFKLHSLTLRCSFWAFALSNACKNNMRVRLQWETDLYSKKTSCTTWFRRPTFFVTIRWCRFFTCFCRP